MIGCWGVASKRQAFFEWLFPCRCDDCRSDDEFEEGSHGDGWLGVVTCYRSLENRSALFAPTTTINQ